jgi:hypothetical protein
MTHSCDLVYCPKSRTVPWFDRFNVLTTVLCGAAADDPTLLRKYRYITVDVVKMRAVLSIDVNMELLQYVQKESFRVRACVRACPCLCDKNTFHSPLSVTCFRSMLRITTFNIILNIIKMLLISFIKLRPV